MKILVVCQYFYPEQFRVNDICFELAKSGHEITVLTGLPNYPQGIVPSDYKWFRKRKEEINGVKVIRSSLIGRGNSSLKLALNYISFALSSSIKALFLKKNFDIILVYQLSPVTMAIPAILLKKWTRKPLVLYCHDLWPESVVSAGISNKSVIYKLLFRVSRWIYESADEIFSSSKLFEEYFSGQLKIRKKITHIPVYAESLFEQIKSSETNKETIDLVFAGNIGEMQSVETIIYAANELRQDSRLKFHIVGDGSSRAKCEALVNQLKLENVIFYGQHPVTEMPRFYDLADAFLITLKANKFISYTLPNKVQSYMAAGKPIIGAIDGETQIVIQEANCGYCSKAEDYIGLAQNIKKFAKDKEKHKILGENARRYYDNHFSKSVFMKQINAILAQTRGQRDVRHVQG